MSKPNRRLSHFGDNPGADPTGVEDDRGEDEQLDVDDDRPDYLRGDAGDDVQEENDEPECVDCGSPAEFSDPNAVLGHDALPSEPLCRPCILDRA